MSKTKIDKHKLHNNLTRLRSILECIEIEGDEFVNQEVSNDIIESINFITSEFEKVLTRKEV